MLPIIPLHIQNALGSGSAQEQLTDYRSTEEIPEVPSGVRSSYRTPANRATGIDVFRRYADGTLDIEYAKHKVVDMIHKVKEGAYLTEWEKCILCCCYPDVFFLMDHDIAADMLRITMRVSPAEMLAIAQAVSAFLAEEMNYNAGLGGGSVPGRSSTRA